MRVFGSLVHRVPHNINVRSPNNAQRALITHTPSTALSTCFPLLHIPIFMPNFLDGIPFCANVRLYRRGWHLVELIRAFCSTAPLKAEVVHQIGKGFAEDGEAGADD